ncbi:MAG: protein kinase domain-containing protein [Limnospira sp.]
MNSATQTILQHGKYRLDRVLGRGEFGVTYQATHLHIGQTVAIKTLSRHPGEQHDISQLRHQAIAIAQRWSLCQHPNLVRILDLFDEGGYPFIVMQFVPGESLQTLVRPGHPLPAPQAVHYIRQIASALDIAHRQGLLHCNLQPTSIVRRTGSRLVMLADFGVGSFLQPDTANRYVPNRALGGGFAALEQYLPHEKPTPGTDIYRLSAILYYLLTGEAPLEAPLCASHLTEELLRTKKPSLRQFQPNLNPAVEEAVRWGLELQSRQRPSSISEWLNVLCVPEPAPAVGPANHEVTPPPPPPTRAVNERQPPKPPSPQPKIRKRSRLRVAPLFVLTALLSGWAGFEVTRRYGNGIATRFDPDFDRSGDEVEQLVLDPSKPIFQEPDWEGKKPDSEWDGIGEPQLLGDGSTDVGELLEDVAYEEWEREPFPDLYESSQAMETPDDDASEMSPEPSESGYFNSYDWDDYSSDAPLSPADESYRPPEIPGQEYPYDQAPEPAVPERPSDATSPEPPAAPGGEREWRDIPPPLPPAEVSEPWTPEESRSADPTPETGTKRWDEFPPSEAARPELEWSGMLGEESKI